MFGVDVGGREVPNVFVVGPVDPEAPRLAFIEREQAAERLAEIGGGSVEMVPLLDRARADRLKASR